MWGYYNNTAAQDFQHDVVNHQDNFVDSDIGVTFFEWTFFRK